MIPTPLRRTAAESSALVARHVAIGSAAVTLLLALVILTVAARRRACSRAVAGIGPDLGLAMGSLECRFEREFGFERGFGFERHRRSEFDLEDLGLRGALEVRIQDVLGRVRRAVVSGRRLSCGLDGAGAPVHRTSSGYFAVGLGQIPLVSDLAGPVGPHVAGVDPSLRSLVLSALLVAVAFTVTTVSSTDRVATVQLKAGALVLVCVASIAPFVEPIRTAFGRELGAATAVLVGAAIWNERDRARPRGRDRERIHDRFTGRLERFARFVRLERNPYPIALAALTAAAVVVYGYRLGAHHLYGDEYQVVAAAGGYYHTGEFYRWDWLRSQPMDVYDRAWPHTLLVATSYELVGISEWSSRLPSALAGVVTVPLSYYVFRYFTERRPVALASSAALLLYPSVIWLFRWTRMYALVIPLFLLLAYLVCRVLTEENSLDFGNERVTDVVGTWANFDLGLAVLTLPVLYLGYLIHVNALFVVVVAYLFVVCQSIRTREPRYVTAAAVGTGGVVATSAIAWFTDRLGFLPYYVSAFERENTEYVDFLFQFPLYTSLGIAFFVAGLVAVHSARSDSVRTKLLFLYLLCAFSLVFMIFVADRYPGFRYVVHVVPFAIVLVLYGFVAFLELFDRRAIRYLLIALLLANVAFPLYAGPHGEDYRTLYVEDEQDFTTAYGTIERNYDPEEEAIFGQYLRKYYLQGVDEDATVVDMRRNQRYSPEEFREDVSTHGSGWLTWETIKTRHVHPEIREYADEHFEKHHGEGVDDTGLEVYYFDESMIDEAG